MFVCFDGFTVGLKYSNTHPPHLFGDENTENRKDQQRGLPYCEKTKRPREESLNLSVYVYKCVYAYVCEFILWDQPYRDMLRRQPQTQQRA